MENEKAQILIFIEKTEALYEKLNEVFEISNSARLGKESVLLDKFKKSLHSAYSQDNDLSILILEKEIWEYEIEKRSWTFDNIELFDLSAIIRIHHDPLSNYSDLMHLLVYVGIKVEDIRVEDELFGIYSLIDIVNKNI